MQQILVNLKIERLEDWASSLLRSLVVDGRRFCCAKLKIEIGIQLVFFVNF